MAIARDATSSSALTSWSHTCTGSNLKLFVAVTGDVSGTDNTTAVTYNGVSLTKVATVQKPSDRLLDLWYLDSPATGANTIAITNATFHSSLASSYAGCALGLDSQNTGSASSASTLSVATTVVAANCWLVGMMGNNNGANTAGTGTSIIVDDGPNGSSIVDSNGTVATGSQALVVNKTGANNWAGVVVSIAPFVAVATGGYGTSRMLSGVGT